MNKELKAVSTATFGGRKFRVQQIIDIQKTVSTFPNWVLRKIDVF